MLEQYFTDERIINQICKERVKLAGQRYDRRYINRLAGHGAESTPNHAFYSLTPPRRQWSIFRPRCRIDGRNPDLSALRMAITTLRQQQPNLPWVIQLNRYIQGIRERVFTRVPFNIVSPRISWELKKKGGHEYRALASFSPDDNLILCLFAQYLRDVFDSQFSDTSYAFRAANDGFTPTHHAAFNDIGDLRQRFQNLRLFAAECDIKGFFDTVDHDLALLAFRRAAGRVTLHARTETLFMAYLECFSFPRNVLDGAGSHLREEDPQGFFKWPDNELAAVHGVNPRNLRIGIPQGGAVSTVIANLVMDAADKCVEAKQRELGAEIHYFRFCDDMVLISPKKQHCKAAFDSYLSKLTELGLVFHEPKRTWVYGKRHWGHKSKAPYSWSGEKWFGTVPWLQFVGYQIRYDGLVRPRKESITKHCLKLVDATNKIKFGLVRAATRHHIVASRNQVLASMTAKLVAQGVGRVKSFVTGPKPLCWAAGYKALHNKPFVDTALRTFDKVRKRQIQRMLNINIEYGPGRASTGNVQRPNPVGHLYSYQAQFTNRGGRILIRNPWKPISFKDKCLTWVYEFVKSSVEKWTQLRKRLFKAKC